MANETFVVSKTEFSSSAVLDAIRDGKIPLCPVCRSVIQVAKTPEEAKSLGIPPGMQCSKNSAHFQVEFILKEK